MVATVLFVVLLVVAVAAANALLWILIVLRFRKKRTASLGLLAADLAESGERRLEALNVPCTAGHRRLLARGWQRPPNQMDHSEKQGQDRG